MPKSRRQFLTQASLTVLGAAVTSSSKAQQTPESTPGAPPAFGTAPPVGPEVSAATIAEAEKLMRVELTPAERAQAAGNWRQSLASTMERRTGPKKVALEPTLSPATRWDPSIPGARPVRPLGRFARSNGAPGSLPK